MFHIRKATLDDALKIHEAHMESIRTVCASDYTSAQIAAWGGRPFNEAGRHEEIRKDFVLVVELNGHIEGYGHIRFERAQAEGYLRGLYLTQRVKGQGAGAAVLNALEEAAKYSNCKRIKLYSTLTAKPFYSQKGYKAVGEKVTMNIGGEEIPCFKMAKILD